MGGGTAARHHPVGAGCDQQTAVAFKYCGGKGPTIRSNVGTHQSKYITHARFRCSQYARLVIRLYKEGRQSDVQCVIHRITLHYC